MAGNFITFEGGEGAGKSTQISRLRARIEALGMPVVATREPGGSPYAEEIRAFILDGKAKQLGPFAEAVLFTAAASTIWTIRSGRPCGRGLTFCATALRI